MADQTSGNRLREAMASRCISIPGAFNGLVARAVAEAGFEAAYVSGGATSAAAGVPDIGLLSLDRFCQMVREVVDGSGLPVLADADTGFGEEEMVRRTVIEYARAGAAGLHLEDQVFPKRCGHLDGKELVAQEHFTGKIAWAAEAAREVGGGFVLCARTDAAGVEGMDAAIARATAYVQAGADMIFPEGLRSEGDFGRFAEAMRKLDGPDPRGGPYLLANMTEFGKTPMLAVSRFGELGYSCVIHPVSTLRTAMGAVAEMLGQLRETGSVEGSLDGMQTRAELYGLLGYDAMTPWKAPVR